jgi:hypothetical protein
MPYAVIFPEGAKLKREGARTSFDISSRSISVSNEMISKARTVIREFGADHLST